MTKFEKEMGHETNHVFGGAARGGLLRFAEDKKAEAKDAKKPQVQVCFVLDTTGSMGGLIEGQRPRSGPSPTRSSSKNRRPK